MATKVLELGLLVPQHVGKLEDPPEVRMADKIIEIAHGMMTLSMMLMSRLVQCCEMNTGGAFGEEVEAAAGCRRRSKNI